MEQIVQHLKQSRNVLVASHANPDGDAIGALIAMGAALELVGKTTTWFNESPIPAVYRFLPEVDRIVSHTDAVKTADTAVILDCGKLSRVGRIAESLKRIPMLINLDHHVTNDRFGDLNLIDTTACATAEIVYRLVKRLGVARPSPAIANAVYTGILTDTGSFRFSNTNQAAFAICEEMVNYGVDPSTVAQHVYGTYSMGRIKLLNLALDSIEISTNGKLSVMTLSRDMFEETQTKPEDVDGFIHYAQRIQDVKVAALIQENAINAVNGGGGRRFHVSLRSDGNVDVATIASAFGGGGHASAAGFNVDGSLAELKSRIIELAEQF